MNIGFVSQELPYLPSPGGFRLYGGNLIRCLSRRHRIDLVSLLHKDDEQHLDWARPFCASVKTVRVSKAGKLLAPFSLLSAYLWGRPLRQRRRLRQKLNAHAHEWDVLHIEGAHVAAITPSSLPLPKVLSLHDSWTLRCEEMLKCTQSPSERLYYTMLKYFEPRFERLVYPRFERCVLVAARDMEAVRQTVPNVKVDLIPYGVDIEYFHPIPMEKQEAALVFHGHFGYAPNIDAALEFADNVFPLIRRAVPDVVFHLVGANPVSQVVALSSRPGIRLSANLPDLRSAVCSARIYVSAVRHGTGLKSKMLEAMAMRMPIVCYPGSTVGLDCVPGKHLLVAQTPEAFARSVVELLRQPERAERLASEAQALVEERYSWESRARAYEELYERVIEERQAQGSGSSNRQRR